MIETKGMTGTDIYFTTVSIRQLNQMPCLLVKHWPLFGTIHSSKPCHATIRCLILLSCSHFHVLSDQHIHLANPISGIFTNMYQLLSQLSSPNTEHCAQQTIIDHVKRILIWFLIFQGIGCLVWFFVLFCVFCLFLKKELNQWKLRSD